MDGNQLLVIVKNRWSKIECWDGGDFLNFEDIFGNPAKKTSWSYGLSEDPTETYGASGLQYSSKRQSLFLINDEVESGNYMIEIMRLHRRNHELSILHGTKKCRKQNWR